MRTVQLGSTGIEVPNIISGQMRIGQKTDEQIRELYSTARDAGIDFFDHADIYGWSDPDGGLHHCESRFAQALKLSPAERAEITIQTKAGIVTDPYWGFDFSYERIVTEVEGSLKALNTDYIDVLLLHRPDALVQPEEVARALDELEASGKVRAFGVSNHTPRQIDLLKTAVKQPFIANQLQLSVTHSALVAQGLAANMIGFDDSFTRDGGGLVEYCRINNITIQAWSPMQTKFGGEPLVGSKDYPELNEMLDRLAAKYDVEPTTIATAWITRHPGDFQVVMGTTSPDRLRAAAAASELMLTRQEWYELIQAAGHFVP
ncbi:aldo/keto reductase [Schaalia vaccimaxillae]|uniref:aldo/keto reductase n=1 Tax=Schaalia vaccimaxillae TaxID=183916 RepID=UPI0003B35730|nr:aldo/keto reductase [Schaalia vaccimaxillae]